MTLGFDSFLLTHKKVICDSKDKEFIIKSSWDRAQCLHVEEQDRHQEKIYLYSSINKRSQVNHTFVLKLEHSTLHVLKKARKFPQTGTAAPSASSVHPPWHSGIGVLQQEKGPSTARLLQVGRLTPRVWSWAGGHCISGAKQSLLHCQRSAGDDCLLPETKILQYTFSYGILIASLVMGLTQARKFLLCHR